MQQMRDAVRHHARLAAARPGQNQQRAIDMRHRRELRLGERFKNIRRFRRSVVVSIR